MQTEIYLHSSKESNYEKAQELGLSEEAANKFMYACYEVKLTVDVDEATGDAKIVAVDDVRLSA